ncbi:hypothetical protein [Actinokineospora fastidiosa]|nr:hypothetical protein [Actinokineospora fastidiosa]
MRMNYACDDGYGYGDVDQSAKIWTLFFQSDGSPEVIEVPVRTAWF